MWRFTRPAARCPPSDSGTGLRRPLTAIATPQRSLAYTVLTGDLGHGEDTSNFRSPGTPASPPNQRRSVGAADETQRGTGTRSREESPVAPIPIARQAT